MRRRKISAFQEAGEDAFGCFRQEARQAVLSEHRLPGF